MKNRTASIPNDDKLLKIQCWQSWKARNAKVFEDKDVPSHTIVHEAMSQLTEFKTSQLKLSLLIASMQWHIPKSWAPPPSRFLKLNFDGATNTSQVASSSGFII